MRSQLKNLSQKSTNTGDWPSGKATAISCLQLKVINRFRDAGPEHIQFRLATSSKHNTGDWPSGKATGSGPVIGGSNPSSPASFNNRDESAHNSEHFLFCHSSPLLNGVRIPHVG